MAIKVDYVTKETGNNLRRNFLMTVAAVLTVAVSLSLVGGALLVRQGVSRASIQWKGDIDLSIYMKIDASQTEHEAIERQLADMAEVKRVVFVDQDQAFAEFRKMFANTPEFIESITAEDLPPSYRVVPHDPELTEVIGNRFVNVPGVQEVVYAKDTIDALLAFTRALQIAFVTIAGVLLLSASLLILNSIQMAIFARRREVAVMKLVGATNWFIRVPFMLEGLIQGVIGAGFAFLVIFMGRNLIAQAVERNALFEQLLVSPGEAFGTGMFVLFVGAIVGAIGSFIAVSRFLDV
ncbi:MAG: permease-like cell division protein FtsX [Acidimicrobiales bacterium]